MTIEHFASWLLTPPSLAGVIDPFAVVYGIVFIVGFVLVAYVAGPGGAPLRARVNGAIDVERWSRIGMGIFGAGLVFFGARLLQINPLAFGAPIWMLAATLAFLIAAARCIWTWRTNIAADMPNSAEQPLEHAEVRSA